MRVDTLAGHSNTLIVFDMLCDAWNIQQMDKHDGVMAATAWQCTLTPSHHVWHCAFTVPLNKKTDLDSCCVHFAMACRCTGYKTALYVCNADRKCGAWCVCSEGKLPSWLWECCQRHCSWSSYRGKLAWWSASGDSDLCNQAEDPTASFPLGCCDQSVAIQLGLAIASCSISASNRKQICQDTQTITAYTASKNGLFGKTLLLVLHTRPMQAQLAAIARKEIKTLRHQFT